MSNGTESSSPIGMSRGLYVYLWLPQFKIHFSTYAKMRTSILKNGAAGIVAGPGAHKSQGHAMIWMKNYTGLDQKCYGKTTVDALSDTESIWMNTLLLNRTPARGVEALVRHASRAHFQSLNDLKADLDPVKGKLQVWFLALGPAPAEQAAAWIARSNQPGQSDPLLSNRWGFGRGCTNWAHGVLNAAGLLADPKEAYRTAYAHRDVWQAEGVPLDSDRQPWRLEPDGDYAHPIDFLTPRMLRELLHRKGFERIFNKTA